jgi:Tfp pilus assembly protein PilF
VPAPDTFNARAANEIAVKQGVGVVLAGSIVPQGSGYEVAIKAHEAVTGNPIAHVRRRASSREQVLAAATSLATDVREALGDDTSDSARRFATDTLSTTSLDVVRNYALAMEAMADGKFEEALARAEQSQKADPSFGLAYVTMASASRNLDRVKDAEQYALEAVRHVDGMTERERYRARGLVYMATGDYQQCLKEFGDMLGRYAADVVAYNNLAFCQTQLRDMTGAVSSVRRAAEILPKRALYRLNLALYAAYAGDFATAEKEAAETQQLGNPLGLQPFAYAQVAQGRLADAAQRYSALAMVNPQGASIGSSGLADIAAYQGRFTEAVRLYSEGAAADTMRGSTERAAAKLAAVASIQLAAGQRAAAAATARTALAEAQGVRTRLLAGRVLAQAGNAIAARAVATKLAAELPIDAQAAAKIIEANIALEGGQLPQAIQLLTESTEMLNTWIGQFDLGRANLAAKRFTQADSAFDRCLKRAGELFLDEEPSYAYLPPVYYFQGRAREEQRSVNFADSYRAYLRLRGNSTEDPIVADARKRAG